jgi:hypothetical protein
MRGERGRRQLDLVPEKRPWEMTIWEYLKDQGAHARSTSHQRRRRALARHERIVADAVAVGEPVPREVLVEYRTVWPTSPMALRDAGSGCAWADEALARLEKGGAR